MEKTNCSSKLPDPPTDHGVIERINNPIHFYFLNRTGTWEIEPSDSGRTFVLVSKAGPKSQGVKIALMDFTSLRDIKEAARLIEKAPLLADKLDTIQQWAPTILKSLPPLERKILESVFEDINGLLDFIAKK